MLIIISIKDDVHNKPIVLIGYLTINHSKKNAIS